MASIPPPAPLKAIIPALFSNNVRKTSPIDTPPNTKRYYTFARAALTDEQIEQISYPVGFIPLNFYIVYQSETRTTYQQHLVAFATKYDGYIYGLYFDINAQDKYDRCVLKTSKLPITIAPTAAFIDGQYLELYLNIQNNPTILGLVTKTEPLASIQYSKGDNYMEVFTGVNGIEGQAPKITITDLSRNLHKIHHV